MMMMMMCLRNVDLDYGLQPSDQPWKTEAVSLCVSVMCVSDMIGCTACPLDCALGVSPLPPTLTLQLWVLWSVHTIHLGPTIDCWVSGTGLEIGLATASIL
jgi:hypothetical protein